MKVLAAVIVPPHLSASGAANAAKHLSASLANYCDIDIAILSLQEVASNFGKARLLARKSSNILSFTKGFLPNKFRTLFYRADIPTLIKNGSYDLVHLHNVIPALETKRVARACVKKEFLTLSQLMVFLRRLPAVMPTPLNIFMKSWLGNFCSKSLLIILLNMQTKYLPYLPLNTLIKATWYRVRKNRGCY